MAVLPAQTDIKPYRWRGQILFLNKNDLFEKKIEHSDIKTFFPVSSRSSSAVPPLTAAFSAFRIMMVNQGMLVVDENTSRNALQD